VAVILAMGNYGGNGICSGSADGDVLVALAALLAMAVGVAMRALVVMWSGPLSVVGYGRAGGRIN
jgi:hypothetical protein